MYTQEERAKFKERFLRWKQGLPAYKDGKPIEDEPIIEQVDATNVYKPLIIASTKLPYRSLFQNAQIQQDNRSQYQRNRDQEAARQAFVQYLQQKDALKQAEGGQQLLEVIGLGLDAYTLGSVGSILTKGLSHVAKKGVQSAANKLARSNASNILSTRNNFRFELPPEAQINIPVQKALPASVGEYPPEFYYTGRIPKRTLDLQELQLQNKGTLIMKDIQEDPSNYTFLEIDNAFKEYRDATKNSNTVPIRLPSGKNVILMGGQTFREHLKNNINPVLRHDGFKGVPLDASPEEAMQYVREKYRELNTFSRGLADPRDFHQWELYNKIYSKLEKKLQRPPTHDEIMDYTAVTPNRGTTGHGTIGRGHGEYTLYTSNGMDQSVGYALRGDRPSTINPLMRAVYELLLPELMPNENTYDTRFSPIGNYILNNRIALENRSSSHVKDLYSEYQLPYQLATGKSMKTAHKELFDIDYERSYMNTYNVPANLVGNITIKSNNEAEHINSVLKEAGSDIKIPYIKKSTAYKQPEKAIRLKLFISALKPIITEFEKASLEWPDYMQDLLKHEFLKDIKNTLRINKGLTVNHKWFVKNPSELDMKRVLEEAIGPTPTQGYLKHKYAHNAFLTEGRKRAITVNDKRYLHPTSSRDKDASLLHYVFYNHTGEPMLDIKRRVPFEEWKDYKNHGSDHWGSYFPGYSRRMSSLIPPIISAAFYKNYKNEAQP